MSKHPIATGRAAIVALAIGALVDTNVAWAQSIDCFSPPSDQVVSYDADSIRSYARQSRTIRSDNRNSTVQQPARPSTQASNSYDSSDGYDDSYDGPSFGEVLTFLGAAAGIAAGVIGATQGGGSSANSGSYDGGSSYCNECGRSR